MPNWMFRDGAPSIYGVMVYGALASHQGKGGIYPSRQTLAAEAQCSVRKVADALNELEQLGAIARVRRLNARGQATNGYVLNPSGELGDDEGFEVEAPRALTGGVEAHGALGGGTSEQIAPLIEEEPLKKNALELFDEFWDAYPRHVAKAAARTKFVGLAKTVNLEVVVAGARAYAADPNLPEPTFIPHPTTWLNQGRWEDEALPKRSDRDQVPAGVAAPAVDVDAETRQRDAWLAARGITLEEYSQHWDEEGWLESLERKLVSA